METEKKQHCPSFEQAEKNCEKKSSPKHLSPVLFVVLGVLAGIGIKLFCFDLLRVSGSSMEPAITSGSQILVNKLAYGVVQPL